MTRIFISHSHQDEEIADLLVDFLEEAIALQKTDIRCTSDPNHGLNFSPSPISEQLRNDLKNSGALIVIATIDSLKSPWILFEVGSFWTTDKVVAPIVGPGLSHEELPGPLRGYRGIQIENEDVSYQINELVNQLTNRLQVQQRVTRRRDKKLEAFISKFREWKPQLPNPDLSQQQQIEELERSRAKITQLENQLNQERLQSNQIQEIKATSQREKEKLEKSIQDYQLQIKKLEQDLGKERSQLTKQMNEIKRLRQQRGAVTTGISISRKQFLKWSGFSSVGLVGAVVFREVFKAPPMISVAEPKYIASSDDILQILRFGLPWRKIEFETVSVDNKGEVVQRFKNRFNLIQENLNLENSDVPKPGSSKIILKIILKMIFITGETFMMGSLESEGKDNEKPRHKVTVKSFLIGQFPITQAQWKEIASLPKIDRDLELDPSYFKGNNRPVDSVSWFDAVEFCQRLSKKTGREYRLPSEAEWEYACRAGTTTPFHFGETITSNLANYKGTSTFANEPKGEYRGETMTVGSFPPNAFGLYDMHGNVWEWCQDDWHSSYVDAPNNGNVWLSEESNTKVIRGGSWGDYPAYCRSASRYSFDPEDANKGFGFRVACSVPRR